MKTRHAIGALGLAALVSSPPGRIIRTGTTAAIWQGNQPGRWVRHNGLYGPEVQPESDSMAMTFLEEQSIDSVIKATAHLVKLPQTKMWLDYDAESDPEQKKSQLTGITS
jgi:hypothetical protein